MFIGHFAVGFAAKRVVPEANLGLLFLASQLLDLVWPVLVLAGIERVAVDHGATVVTPLNFEHYPYSHSLAMAVLYSVAFTIVGHAVLRSWRGGLVLGGVTLSHWILDFVTHRADLPILLASEKYGLGLWNSLAATLIVEVGMFVAGVLLYLRVKGTNLRPKSIWTLIAFLGLIYAANVFGPRPPIDTPGTAIAAPGVAMWLLVIWATLADRKAKVRA